MTLKQLIDQIARACNGALQRSEILLLIDQAQAKMYAPKCSELLQRTTITPAEATTYPAARTITWDADPRMATTGGQSYVPGDIMMTPYASPQSFLVVSPFTLPDPLTLLSVNTYLQDNCLQLPHSWVAFFDPSTTPHEGVVAVDGLAITAGQFVWYPDVEQWWICFVGYTVDEDTLEDDRLTHCQVPERDPIVDGETTQETAMPESVSVSGFREISIVGTVDENSGEWLTKEDVKIVQARTRDDDATIYTDGLTAGSTYTIEGYVWPDSVTSESDDLMVPDSDRDGILKTIVMREIELESFGASTFWQELYQVEWPKWLDRINRDKTRPQRRGQTTFNPLAG